MKTKNSILVTLVLSLIATVSVAQVNFGLRTGVAATTLAPKGNLLENNNTTLSYTAGAFASVPLSQSFAFQPEINYIRKGRTDETSELSTTSASKFSNDYLQVPLLLQFRDARSLSSNGTAFYINAGPYAGFVLDSRAKTNAGGAMLALSESKKTDWGASFGIGYQSPLFSKAIRFDLRYDMGLSEIANQPADYRTKALSLTVGIVL